MDAFPETFDLPVDDMRETTVLLVNYDLAEKLYKERIIFSQKDTTLPFQEITLGFDTPPVGNEIFHELMRLENSGLISRFVFSHRLNKFPVWKIEFATTGNLDEIIPVIRKCFAV
jgi:hypothetical protein